MMRAVKPSWIDKRKVVLGLRTHNPTMADKIAKFANRAGAIKVMDDARPVFEALAKTNIGRKAYLAIVKKVIRAIAKNNVIYQAY